MLLNARDWIAYAGSQLVGWAFERVTADPAVPSPGRVWERANLPYGAISFLDNAGTVRRLQSHIVWPLGSEFQIDNENNEVNGWGPRGPFDDRHNIDLGGVGSNLSRISGGLVFPFDVRVERMYAWFSPDVPSPTPWGWVLAKQTKTPNSNARATTYIVDEASNGVGVDAPDADWAGTVGDLRDYPSTVNQRVDLDLTGNAENVLTAGDVLVLGVGHPGTASSNNREARVMGGYLLLAPV